MHVLARILLGLGLLVLSVLFLATLEYKGVSWNEGLLGIVPATLFVLVALRWAKHPPKRLGVGSPPWLAFQRRARVRLNVFGIVYFVGLGAGTALYSADQESSYRQSAADSKREARAALLREASVAKSWDAPPAAMGASYRDLDANARESARKADACEQGTRIGVLYCGVALFPLIGLLLALASRRAPTAGTLPLPNASAT
ncbi:MAG: hypothetical protein JNL79_23865 [Myxococcales bacterium]|nr:hypothetical protein [Myxococcales bacterium]